MAARFLWKPIAQGSVGGGRATVLFNNYDPSDQFVSGGLYTQDGQLVENFTLAPRGSPSAELPNPESASKFYGSKPGFGYGDNLYFEATTQSGKKQRYNIPSGGGRYAGDIGNPDPQFENKPMGGGGYAGQFAPGQIGYGFFPAFLGGEFPQFNYNFIDPEEFAAKFGDFSRNELLKNFDIAQDLSLKELDLELESLQKFVPAASALKRQETAIDNIFNQAQRTAQIDATIPYARSDLRAQADRARAFASGRLPDEIEDRVLEGNVRSRAADAATFGGFGVRSPAAQKASQLMSAEQRLQLSQYGEQLLGTNLDRSAQLLLAPTEYSDAGSQIRVNPSVSPAQLINQNLGFIHQATSISPGQALQTAVGQEQFRAQSAFNAELAKFGYIAQYAGAVAGAAQTDLNTQMALEQQRRTEEIFADAMKETQGQNTIQDIASGISQLITAAAGLIKGNSTSTGEAVGGGETPSVSEDAVPSIPDIAPDYGTQEPAGPDISGSVGSPEVSGPSGTGEVPDFTYGEEPTYTLSARERTQAQNFSQDTGIPAESVPKTVIMQGNSVLNSAGISNTRSPVSQKIGVDTSGRTLYADKALLASNNAGLGADSIGVLKTAFNPLGILTDEDASALDKIAAVSRDAALVQSLTTAYQNGDKKGFINQLLSRFQQPLIETLTDNPRDAAGMGSAFGAYQLYENWNRMSPGQRALGIASTGLQGYRFATGENLAAKPIISPVIENGKVVRPGLNTGQALQLFQAGYNVYSLVKNWDQYNTIQKVAAGTGTAANVAELAKQFNLLGKGTTGAAVNVSASQLANSGFTSAPHLGNGAIVGAPGSKLPEGFIQAGVDESGNIVGVPNGLQSTVPDIIRQGAGAASVALGAYTVYKGWGTGGTKGAINGALGGTAMVSGLSMLGYSNPYTAAAIIATSVLGNAIQVGKSGDQQARDSVRSVFNKLGLSDKDGNITLADGSKASIGIDGHGNMRNAKDSSLIERGQKKLNAWDVDYTNDLDYAAGMGGIALSRIASGGANKAIDQVGGNIGNASLMNIGYGKEFTQANFNKMAANQRAIYAQSGIKSKSDAFQLANQAYAEGRIDETQLVAAHQAFNFIFDNDYAMAQKLMAGRNRGVEVAQELANVPQTEVPKNIPKRFSLGGSLVPTKDLAKETNRFRYQGATA